MRRLFLLLSFVAAVARAERADFLLAAATDGDLRPLIQHLEKPETVTRAAWTFWTGTIAGHRVAITRTEGDPLNAVAATTLGIRMFEPRLVVTFGSARPLEPGLHSGEIVVSSRFAAFDGTFTPTDIAGGGIHPLKWYKLRHPMMTPGEVEKPTQYFAADAGAVSRLEALAGKSAHVIGGTLGSANQVNREADRIEWLNKQWGVDTEDGESAHIAGCAMLLDTPVAGLRVVNGAPGDASKLILEFVEGSK